METIATRKRIEYIDALRGFTMLLVIFGHIELFGLGIKLENSVIFTMFNQFHMPLFFFISGFFAYNAKKSGTAEPHSPPPKRNCSYSSSRHSSSDCYTLI